MPRFCPVTLDKSKSETDELCVHISEAGYDKLRSAHVGTDKELVEKVQGIYAIFGRTTAGPISEHQMKKHVRQFGRE